MCSICGVVDYKRQMDNATIINDMNGSMKYRGPDASGTLCLPNVALGHNRLSIIDLSGGSQPMSVTHEGVTYFIVYNGELYNTQQVKNKLSKNNIPDTNSDTEVLLRSYIEWGEKCLEYINGIFAFAIWNTANDELFCARDHLGVKPFFYTICDESFVFASEIKGILKHPDIHPILNMDGLRELIGICPARTPGKTCYKDIFELKRGHCVKISKNGIKTRKYWDIKAQPHNESLEDTIEHVKYLVLDSIRRQLVSDVELGCFLSGGLDSSIISSVASRKYRAYHQTLKTFSVDFIGNRENFKPSVFQPNADFDYIDLVSEYIESDHYNIVLDSKSQIRALKRGVAGRDMPGMADIDTSLLLFCNEVKKHVKVALSGECADEIFGGYPWFHNPHLYEDGVFPWGGNIDFRKSLVKEDIGNKLGLKDYIANSYTECINSADRLDSDTDEVVARRQMFMLNIDYFMANLLERKDRMSMASGLEVRVPFCDYKLVEYAYNIPWSLKSIDNKEKGVLRRAAKNYLPQIVLNRKKSPYPKTYDPEYTKEIVKIFKNKVLDNRDSKMLAVFDGLSLSKLCDSTHIDKPWFGQLMATPQLLAFLYQVEIWLDEYNVDVRL